MEIPLISNNNNINNENFKLTKEELIKNKYNDVIHDVINIVTNDHGLNSQQLENYYKQTKF